MLFHPPHAGVTARRVAVIDDDLDCRETIAAAIDSAAMSASKYASAESFLGCRAIHDFSCLLVDIRLPGMSGLELLQTLKQRGVEAAVVVMSGAACVVDVVRAFENQAGGFFQKPLPIQKLLDTVQRLVEQIDEQRSKRVTAANRVVRLTPREREVMHLLTAGDKTVQIAHKLHISPSTVEKHRLRIFAKTETNSVVELIHSLSSVTPLRV